MSDEKLTTGEIRAEWISAQDWAGMNPKSYYGPMFDRWLREHDASVLEAEADHLEAKASSRGRVVAHTPESLRSRAAEIRERVKTR